MKKDLTEIIFILDESGSMSDLTDDTIGGFNSLIEKQRSGDGDVIVSTVLFSSSSKVIYDRVPLDDVRKMTRSDYCPGGSTALLDAVGGAVKHISNVHKYARDEDVPEHTLVIITTDGMENASRTYTSSKVKKMISDMQEKQGWQFIFMGANIDSVDTAGSIGICAETAVNYRADRKGTNVLYDAISNAMCGVRQGKKLKSNNVWRECVDADMASQR
ncbi:MAG: VWA domain-containing protein [Oscillospiraceae bacterium]|nr:VWA domain-containing protein [Oscillospiraceae bacterium]